MKRADRRGPDSQTPLPRRNLLIVQERIVLMFLVKNTNEEPVKFFNSVIVQMNGLHSYLVPDESSKDAGSIAERIERDTLPLSDSGRRTKAVLDHVQRLLGQMEALLLVPLDLPPRQPACGSILP